MQAVLAALTLSMVPGSVAAQDTITTTHDGLQGDLAGTVEGTLSADAPIVLIHPGSGPTDRDGNSPIGVAASPFRLLAEGLAEQGIASVRIDKRGMFGSAAASADPNAMSVEAYATDIAAWADTIIAQSGAECIWLAGHSEGGVHVLAAAMDDPSRYCGIVLLSIPGRPLDDVIREQIGALPGGAMFSEQVDDFLIRIKAGESVPASEIHPALMPLFAPPVQPFLTSLFNNVPSEMIGGVDLPILIVGGREDLQTPDSDALALAAGQPGARLVLLEGTNHMLKRVPAGDRAANLASYSDPGLPLNPAVLDAVAGFVLGRGPQ